MVRIFTYIGWIERGEPNVGLLNIVNIARTLAVPVSVLTSTLK